MNSAQTAFLTLLLRSGVIFGVCAALLATVALFFCSVDSFFNGKFTKGGCLMLAGLSCIYIQLGWLS